MACRPMERQPPWTVCPPPREANRRGSCHAVRPFSQRACGGPRERRKRWMAQRKSYPLLSAVKDAQSRPWSHMVLAASGPAIRLGRAAVRHARGGKEWPRRQRARGDCNATCNWLCGPDSKARGCFFESQLRAFAHKTLVGSGGGRASSVSDDESDLDAFSRVRRNGGRAPRSRACDVGQLARRIAHALAPARMRRQGGKRCAAANARGSTRAATTDGATSPT